MSTLWLVATPIGNLGDLAPRAVEVLSHAALVCCEDTRRTGLLLQHAGIRAARLAVCNDHTEMSRITDVLRTLGEGRDVAIVSDAGTPGISDPGERIVRAAIDAGYTVSAVPGPSAAIMALTISGLAADRFVFEGFIPRKGVDRADRLAEIAAEHRTVVIYEAPHRVLRTLDDLRDACGGDRVVVVTRELTKLHEQVVARPARRPRHRCTTRRVRAGHRGRPGRRSTRERRRRARRPALGTRHRRIDPRRVGHCRENGRTAQTRGVHARHRSRPPDWDHG